MLEQILCYVGITYISSNDKAAEVGGLLFGYCRKGAMQVMTWRPISRDKDAEAHFCLNGKDERTFQKLLRACKSDGALKGMQVLGWFRSRTEGEAALDEVDIRFHEKFFDEKHHIAMVIRPSHDHPAEAAIYARDAEGNFALSAPLAMFISKANLAEWGEVETESAADSGNSTYMQSGLEILAGLALSCLVILGMQWNHQQQVAADLKDELGFEVKFDDGGIKATWNSASASIRKAETAQLQLGRERMQLSHVELTQGYARVALKDALLTDTEMSMRAGNLEEVSQLIIEAR